MRFSASCAWQNQVWGSLLCKIFMYFACPMVRLVVSAGFGRYDLILHWSFFQVVNRATLRGDL